MPAAPVPPSMSTRSTAIVIDAGSSGSRAHLYTFGVPQLTTIREEWSMKRWPGLSACALKEPNAPSAGVNISGCARKNLSHMLHDLEAGCRAKSVHCAGAPVYLRATAGLRLLQPKERESILQGAAEAIRQSAFRLASLPRTLPGSEEALYDWLMVNAAAAGSQEQAAAALGNLARDETICNAMVEAGGVKFRTAAAEGHVSVIVAAEGFFVCALLIHERRVVIEPERNFSGVAKLLRRRVSCARSCAPSRKGQRAGRPVYCDTTQTFNFYTRLKLDPFCALLRPRSGRAEF